MDRKKTIWLISILFFVLVLAVGILLLLKNKNEQETSEDIYDSLKEEVNTTTEEPDILDELGVTIPPKNLDWDELKKENEDIYAWIYVPDTKVDYPIVRHPSDNEFYLNHNLDKSEGYPGTIYTEDYNTTTFLDRHTVIYGHNLKSGEMFSSLHNFEDEDFIKANKYIFIYTPEHTFVYGIYAAYEFDSIHLLDTFNVEDDVVFEDFLNRIKYANLGVANYNNNFTADVKSKIVSLSTCTSDHNDAERFIVTGVLLNEPK